MAKTRPDFYVWKVRNYRQYNFDYWCLFKNTKIAHRLNFPQCDIFIYKSNIAIVMTHNDNILKVKEGAENDEYLIARISKFETPLNIISIYGEQEPKTQKNEIEQRWNRLLEDITKIKLWNEWIIIVGDFNKHIGNDNLGIKNNHDKISFGGTLIRELIATKKYILASNTDKVLGGPFTRFDPSDPNNNAKKQAGTTRTKKEQIWWYIVYVDPELIFHIEITFDS